ncbi:hypothetical protein ACUNV4_29415 [Granulosicoccus sp. 3-233]|uniref:hypothetical protein n=1 Tax=Granulosicoccus sp. 3-233 TaxID=3417969 RepID=UPI003D324F5E
MTDDTRTKNTMINCKFLEPGPNAEEVIRIDGEHDLDLINMEADPCKTLIRNPGGGANVRIMGSTDVSGFESVADFSPAKDATSAFDLKVDRKKRK